MISYSFDSDFSFNIVVFCWDGGRKEKKKCYLYEGGGRRRSGGLPAGGWWWRTFELIWDPWLVYSFAFLLPWWWWTEPLYLLSSCCLCLALLAWCLNMLAAFEYIWFFSSSLLVALKPWWFWVCYMIFNLYVNDDLCPVMMSSEGLGILTGICGCLIRVPWILALYLVA